MATISSAAELWTSLCSKTGLEISLKSGRKGRDSDVEDSLRTAFGVPKSAKSLGAGWL